MELTSELLKANAATAGLSDDQVKAVVEMSQNDENSVIGQKTGEIYGGLDADILAASGIAKEGAVRTYDYAKRVIGQFKAQAGDAAGLNKQISDLTKEKARLEKVIAEGGADAETKAALTRAKTDLTNVTKEYTELKAKFDKSEETHKAALFGLQLDGEFAKASAGLKFKADLPAAVTDVLMQQAIAKVKGMNPEYIDDGKGGKVLAFMENGAVRRNPANNLNPFTAAELLKNELSAMGVLEVGRQQAGAGSQGGFSGGGQGSLADLSGARTQTEAQEIIAKQLMSEGKVNGSKEYEDAMAKIWKDNIEVIKKLPLR